MYLNPAHVSVHVAQCAVFKRRQPSNFNTTTNPIACPVFAHVLLLSRPYLAETLMAETGVSWCKFSRLQLTQISLKSPCLRNVLSTVRGLPIVNVKCHAKSCPGALAWQPERLKTLLRWSTSLEAPESEEIENASFFHWISDGMLDFSTQSPSNSTFCSLQMRQRPLTGPKNNSKVR